MEERKRVWLSIKGSTCGDQAVPDITEFLTEGDFYREQDTSCFSYEETEVLGMEGTTTTVKVDDGKVSVIRLGSVNSLMEFEEGKRNVTLYSTPYGDFSMGVVTRGVQVAYDDRRAPVRVKVDYNLEIKGLASSSNTIDIQVRDWRA